MVVVAEMEKHTMNVHEVHTVEVLVPKRKFGGSSNYSCKYCYMAHLLEAQCRKVHSSKEGFYSPSWTYKCLDFPPWVADYAALLPLGSNSTLISNL